MPAKEPSSAFIGKKYNMLTILEDLGASKNRRMVSALCECSKIKTFILSDIKSGASPSCGCLKTKRISNLKRTHSLRQHPLHRVWSGMKTRCLNPKVRGFKNYGAKGVVVCPEWKDSFINFYDWAIKNGWHEGLELDKDKRSPYPTGKEYSPDFCCFITPKENSNYKTTSKNLEYKGQTKTLSQWSEELGFDYSLVKARINSLKWAVEKSFETPARKFSK